jgi:hypothetical protein
MAQHLGNSVKAAGKARERLLRAVKDPHIVTGAGQNIGDAMSHQARPDDGDMRLFSHISLP